MSHFSEGNFVDRYATRFELKIDKDWSYREARLHILQKFLNGTLYDNLAPFYREYDSSGDNGKYIPLAKRRPCVIYNLPKIIVDASVSMLFGEGHFPVPRCNEHEKTTEFLQYITKNCDIRSVMLDAARKGSIGSVAILIKLLDGHFFFEAMHTSNLMPYFKQNNPKELLKLQQKSKVDGSTLVSYGYTIPDDKLKDHYFLVREWDESEEIYYMPYHEDKEGDDNFKPKRDESRSEKHDLGFVPIVWIKNLPKSGGIDGHSTFEDILDICVEIDYQLSQHARLLRYNSDPTLVVKNPTSLQGQELVKSQTTLNLDEKGDAYFAEITTGPTKSVMEYVKYLREIALETVRGNRSSPDKIKSAQSGEALKMLNFELVSLVDEMRLTYGEYGLMQLYCMVLKIVTSGKYDFKFDEQVPQPDKNCEGHIFLDWPAWYAPTEMDKLNQSQTLTTLINGKIISSETATKTVADEYNINDVAEELKSIDNEQNKLYAKEAKVNSSDKENPVAPVAE